MYAAATVTEIWIERQLHERQNDLSLRELLSYEKSCEKKFQWLL